MDNFVTMIIKMIESESTDPWYNLALEEYLLSNLQTNEIILYLWQNDQTVVIGANQNPWKECNLNLLDKDGGKLARRISGGGAVYHDLGNLNFTFLVNRDFYDFNKQIKIIIDSLAQHEIKAEFTGRNDIIVNGKKISGNAFYQNESSALHHGTILIDSDFSMMTKYLQVYDKKIQSKGIDSVRSRVMNLKELIPKITVEAVKDSIRKQYVQSYGHYKLISCHDVMGIELNNIYQKHASWDWRFGDTPEYDISFSNYFIWGALNLELNLDKGIISDIKVYSDAMDVRLSGDIKKYLMGLPLDADVIKGKYHECKEAYALRDIIDWIAVEIYKL